MWLGIRLEEAEYFSVVSCVRWSASLRIQNKVRHRACAGTNGRLTASVGLGGMANNEEDGRTSGDAVPRPLRFCACGLSAENEATPNLSVRSRLVCVTATGRGARVAPRHCPILRTGISSICGPRDREQIFERRKLKRAYC
jgi:hypothetical protein